MKDGKNKQPFFLRAALLNDPKTVRVKKIAEIIQWIGLN